MRTHADSIIKGFVLDWKAMILFAVLAIIFTGLQTVVGVGIRDQKTIARHVTCTVVSTHADGKMQLACSGKGEKALTDADLALSYVLKPRPLTCTLYASAAPDCEFKK